MRGVLPPGGPASAFPASPPLLPSPPHHLPLPSPLLPSFLPSAALPFPLPFPSSLPFPPLPCPHLSPVCPFPRGSLVLVEGHLGNHSRKSLSGDLALRIADGRCPPSGQGPGASSFSTRCVKPCSHLQEEFTLSTSFRRASGFRSEVRAHGHPTRPFPDRHRLLRDCLQLSSTRVLNPHPAVRSPDLGPVPQAQAGPSSGASRPTGVMLPLSSSAVPNVAVRHMRNSSRGDSPLPPTPVCWGRQGRQIQYWPVGTCRQALGHARRCRGSPLRERTPGRELDVPLPYHGHLRFLNPKGCFAADPLPCLGLQPSADVRRAGPEHTGPRRERCRRSSGARGTDTVRLHGLEITLQSKDFSITLS